MEINNVVEQLINYYGLGITVGVGLLLLVFVTLMLTIIILVKINSLNEEVQRINKTVRKYRTDDFNKRNLIQK